MPTKHNTGAKSTVVHCSNCGEDYSITYKRCPFCDERTTRRPERMPEREYEPDDDEDMAPHRNGGKRLVGGARRGGGYGGDGWSPKHIILTIGSLAIIVAAVWIVVSQLMPLVDRGVSVSPPPVTAPVATPLLPTPQATPPVATDALTGESAPPTSPVTPPSTIPATQTATDFTLNLNDFTLRAGEKVPIKVTFIPAGTTGTITWTSSQPNVVAVSADGVTSPVSKGSVTITATMAGGKTQTCIVRSTATGSGVISPEKPATGTPSENVTENTGSLTLNKTDFTMERAGQTVPLKVSGTSSTPIWSIGDVSVATISGSGVITAVGRGDTTVTVTVDGQTLKCIVRCRF